MLAAIANISNSKGSDLIDRTLIRLICGTLKRGAIVRTPASRTTLLRRRRRAPVNNRVIDNVRRVGHLIAISRGTVKHAPHSGLTACAKLFSRIHGLFTTAGMTGTERCSTKHFSFGIGGKHYPGYRNINFIDIRLLFLPDICSPYRIYRNRHCGSRALRVACRNGGVTRMLSLAIRTTSRFFISSTPVVHTLSTLLGIKLNCLELKRPTARLSNNRTRHVGLTARLRHARHNSALCILSRPAANLRPSSITVLVTRLGKLITANGAIVVIRRSVRITDGDS